MEYYLGNIFRLHIYMKYKHIHILTPIELLRQQQPRGNRRDTDMKEKDRHTDRKEPQGYP